YGLSAIYTPEFVRSCQDRLRRAAGGAKGGEGDAARGARHAAGRQDVVDYPAICDAMTRGDFPAAKGTHDAMVRGIGELEAKGYANREYGTAYLRRFLSRTIEGGLAATAAPNKVVAVLPDKWRFRPDDTDQGEEMKYHTADLDDVKWRLVKTHSATLS